MGKDDVPDADFFGTNGAASEGAAPGTHAHPQPPKPLIEFLDHDELFNPDPPADLLIPALGMCAGPVTGFFGQSYVGKSICTMSLGMAGSLGRPAWGVWSMRRCKWVHLDYEQARRRCKKLIQRLAVGFGATREDLRDWMRLAVYPPVNLTTKDAVDHYARAFDGCGIATVDALKGVTPGVDENSSEMRDYMGALSRASEKTGCVVVLNHNAGKPPPVGQRARKHEGRGSSAIFDECQTVFVATGSKGEPSLITHEKDRELGRTVSDFFLKIVDVAVGENLGAGLRVVHVEPEQVVAGNARPRSQRVQEREKERDQRGAEREAKEVERKRTRDSEKEEARRRQDDGDDEAAKALRAKAPPRTADRVLQAELVKVLACGGGRAWAALVRTRKP